MLLLCCWLSAFSIYAQSTLAISIVDSSVSSVPLFEQAYKMQLTVETQTLKCWVKPAASSKAWELPILYSISLVAGKNLQLVEKCVVVNTQNEQGFIELHITKQKGFRKEKMQWLVKDFDTTAFVSLAFTEGTVAVSWDGKSSNKLLRQYAPKQQLGLSTTLPDATCLFNEPCAQKLLHTIDASMPFAQSHAQLNRWKDMGDSVMLLYFGDSLCRDHIKRIALSSYPVEQFGYFNPKAKNHKVILTYKWEHHELVEPIFIRFGINRKGRVFDSNMPLVANGDKAARFLAPKSVLEQAQKNWDNKLPEKTSLALVSLSTSELHELIKGNGSSLSASAKGNWIYVVRIPEGENKEIVMYFTALDGQYLGQIVWDMTQ